MGRIVMALSAEGQLIALSIRHADSDASVCGLLDGDARMKKNIG
jgi:hypothetical protein